jgi:hypothetical protein
VDVLERDPPGIGLLGGELRHGGDARQTTKDIDLVVDPILGAETARLLANERAVPRQVEPDHAGVLTLAQQLNLNRD